MWLPARARPAGGWAACQPGRWVVVGICRVKASATRAIVANRDSEARSPSSLAVVYPSAIASAVSGRRQLHRGPPEPGRRRRTGCQRGTSPVARFPLPRTSRKPSLPTGSTAVSNLTGGRTDRSSRGPLRACAQRWCSLWDRMSRTLVWCHFDSVRVCRCSPSSHCVTKKPTLMVWLPLSSKARTSSSYTVSGSRNSAGTLSASRVAGTCTS
jgi:hypothetical protein